MSEDNSETIVQKIDGRMGRWWASKLANVLDTDMTLKADVDFVFKKFDHGADQAVSNRNEELAESIAEQIINQQEVS